MLTCSGRYAPDHWQAEAVNAVWSKVFKCDLEAADAEERMQLLLRAPVTVTPISKLMPRAFAISVARSIPIYDSLYVALAEKLEIPLITADKQLLRCVRPDAGLASRMIWLGDIEFQTG
ncbi:MAG: type II toxin-antitoxin system VapC family toxin [Acetobacteraceae bacterium]|nr:type II toxin-antitoxin system VapC family toxin [Acetobacteraceae bacterium]